MPGDRRNTAATAEYALGLTSQLGEVGSAELDIQGDFPHWLDGNLLRVAPARFEVGDQRYNHWFDGLAKLHKFDIRNGHVSYASRFLKSGSYCAAVREGRIARGEFGTDPCRGLFGRLASIFQGRKPADNGNVKVDSLGPDFVALTETTIATRFDPETLETLGRGEYGEPLASAQVSTAHLHHDPQNRRTFSYAVQFGRRSCYRLFSVDDAGRSDLLASIPVDRPSYMHSFGMSERFFVLAEFPLCVNPLRLRFGSEPFIRNYRWKPERGLRFTLIDRASGAVTIVEADAAFGFHHVNAFDEGDHVVVDLIMYPDASIIDELRLEKLRSASPVDVTGILTRYRLPMRGGTAQPPEQLCSTALELPVVNASRQRRTYDFVYGTGVTGPGRFLGSIVKAEIATGDSTAWHETGCYAGEPIFVAQPEARAEDDGILLSVVLDSIDGASFLLVLDAKSMTERARATLPEVVTLGFHGRYFPAAS